VSKHKINAILVEKPDLLILQECSKEDIATVDCEFKYWVGSNKQKGLAVIGFSKHNYTIDASYNPDIPWFIPLSILDINLNVLGSWACMKDKYSEHIITALDAVEYYSSFLSNDKALLIGDLNSNSMWDKNKVKSHSSLVAKLDKLGLDSIYHELNNEKQGAETKHTFFRSRKAERTYHIDYAFLSKNLTKKTSLEIGTPDIWLEFSDHLPIILDITTTVAF